MITFTWILIILSVGFQFSGLVMCFFWLQAVKALRSGWPLLTAFAVQLSIRINDFIGNASSGHNYWVGHPVCHVAGVAIFAFFFLGFLCLYLKHQRSTAQFHQRLTDHQNTA